MFLAPSLRAPRRRLAAARPNTARKARLALEPLEARSLLTTTSLYLAPLQPVEESGSLKTSAEVDTYEVQLVKGDVLAIDVNAPSDTDLKLIVRNAQGKVVFSKDSAIDPAGTVTAASTGLYSVSIKEAGKAPAKTPATFDVNFQRFAITAATAAQNPMDNSANNNHQDRWAWVSGNTLYIADGAGNGFGIISKWHQQVTTNPNGTKSSTFTADGSETINMTVPGEPTKNKQGDMIPGKSHVDTMTLNAPMTVATQASVLGNKVAKVDWTQFGNDFAPTSLGGNVATQTAHADAAGQVSTKSVHAEFASADAASLFNDYGAKYGIHITTANKSYSMGLGKDLGFLGVPLVANHTYFYYYNDKTTSVTFGNTVISKGDGSKNITVVIDPSDPALYVVVGGKFGFGASAKGLIPFTPTASNYSGPTFSGQLWGTVQNIQIGDTPINASGSIVLNIDANNVHGNASTLFTAGGLTSAVLANTEVGVNGTLNVGATVKGVNLSVPVGSASLGYAPASPTHTLIETITTYLNNQYVSTSTKSTPIAQYSSNYQKPSDYTQYSSSTGGVRVENVHKFTVQTTPSTATVQLAGTSINPLAGTPLQNYFSGEAFTFQASSSGNNATDFRNNFSANLNDAGNGINILGYNLGGSSHSLHVHLDSSHFTVNGNMSVLAGTANVNGEMNLANGSFLLTAHFNSGGNIPILPQSSVLNTSSATVQFGYNAVIPPVVVTIPGLVTITVSPGHILTGLEAEVDLGFDYSYKGSGIFGDVGGTLSINAANNKYSGTLSAAAGVHTLLGDISISAGLTLSNTEIDIMVSTYLFGTVTIPIKI